MTAHHRDDASVQRDAGRGLERLARMAGEVAAMNSLTHRLGKHDAHQGLYFLGNYVRDSAGRWRRATFSERLKHVYSPDFIGAMAWGQDAAFNRIARRALVLR